VIDNLLSNAIKYNKIKGSIIIVLDKDYLSIKDSGIGIKKDDLNFIQQRFQRANSSEGGFGIGLDIVGQVVSYYNFKLDIISTYNQGSQFTIRWDI
jgi:two-component system OmpR family sensor kinase